MKKRVNLKNRVSALGLSFFLTLGLITPAFSITAKAEAVEVLESTATVADCVMSYYALCGSAVANVEWINTLYDSLGSSFGTLADFADDGLMFFEDGVWKPAEQLAENISNTSAYTSLGLDNVFNVSAEEVANGGGYAVATGASTLAGACGSVASTGLLPLLGGVTAAYWGGIAIGTLAYHIIDKYAGNIELSAPIDYPVTSDLLAKRYPGGLVGSFMSQGSVKFMFFPSDIILYGYSRSSTSYFQYSYINKTGQARTYRRSDMDGSFTVGTNGNCVAGNAEHETYVWPNMFSDPDERNAFVDGVLDGTVTPEKFQNYSPDIIGADGNQKTKYNSDTGQYEIPDVKPQIDPQTQSGKPLSLQDWLQFANGVQNNNNSTSPVPNNTSLFQDILDAIKGLVPNPGPTPDPNPGGETYPVPGPTPDPSPVPDPEYQPETKPQPQYTEKATENETDITEGDPWTTPDLLDKFPFCIPRDVYRVFTKLDSGARAAPHIQWRFNPNNKIDYTFDIDFSEWDNVATLLRTLELLGFIVALAVATRKMILS